MKLKSRNTSLLFFSLLVVVSMPLHRASAASHSCAAAVEAKELNFKKLSVSEQRREVLKIVTERKLPAFEIVPKDAANPIPVILVNYRTTNELADFMGQSVGTQVQLQPGDDMTDHGNFRLGGFQPFPDAPAGTHSEKPFNLRIDWAAPDTRNWNATDRAEIHSTGIAWRNIDELLRKAIEKGPYARVLIEPVFVADKAQRRILEYYHRVRRATLFGKQSPNNNNQLRPNIKNRTNVEEDCFSYSTGEGLPLLKEALEITLRDYGVPDPAALLKKQTGRDLIQQASKIIFETDLENPVKYNQRMLINSAKLRSVLAKLVPETSAMNKTDAMNLVNALVGLDAVTKAHVTFQELGITPYPTAQANIDNPNVAAFFIYAPVDEETFLTGTFTARGSFLGMGWGQDPEGTVPFATQRVLHK